MSRVRFLSVAALLGTLSLFQTLAAQSVKSSANSTGIHQADALRAQAIAWYDDSSRALDVAKLHLEEVQHRSAHDPEAVRALFLAAFFFKAAGRLGDARRTYEQVAQRVLGLGDVMASAQAYLDAALIADSSGNDKEARRLATKALLLTESPLLRKEQRIWIRNQIRSAPALATIVKK